MKCSLSLVIYSVAYVTSFQTPLVQRRAVGSRLSPLVPSHGVRHHDVAVSERSEQMAVKLGAKIRQACTQLRCSTRAWRRRLTHLLASLLVVMSVHTHSVWAVSGGRAGGGSFGGCSMRSSPSMGRSGRYALPKSYYHTGRPPITILHREHRRPSSSTQLYYRSSFSDVAPARRLTKSDIMLLSGVGAVFVYGFVKNNDRDGDYGASVTTLTVGLDLANDRSLLTRIQDSAQVSTIMDRSAVQQLVADVALELLRHEDSATAAASSERYYPRRDLAERAYQRQSILERRKFSRETFHRYGQEQLWREEDDEVDSATEEATELPPPTKAIVTMHVATEGKMLAEDSMMGSISSYRDLKKALLALASSGSDLLAAEILWSPQRATDVLSRDDMYSHYPELLPL